MSRALHALALATLLLLLLLGGGALAQQVNPVNVIGAVTPGHCVSFFSQTQIADAGGNCGISGGGVGSVSGTTGQITVSPTTGAVVVSLPTTITQSETFSGNVTFTSGIVNFTGTTQLNGVPFGTFATANFATPPVIGGTTPAAGVFTTLTATSTFTTAITGSTQCLQVNTAGVVSGTGSACGAGGGGAVSSVTGTAGQVTVSPTTGAVVVSLPAIITSNETFSGTVNHTGPLQINGTTVTLPITLANGGTNNALTASAGGIVWSDASKLNILAGTSTAGLCLLSGNLATPSWATCPGGGGTPGGANTNIQFNNSGAFGGDAGFTYAGNGQVTHALGTITTNLKALTITGTWNAVGTTFDAPLFMNIVNTASAAASRLIDLQVGGTSFFSANPDGAVTINQAFVTIANTPLTIQYAGVNKFAFSGVGGTIIVNNNSNAGLLFQSGQPAINFNNSTILSDDGANHLEVRNSATAQGFRVYNTADAGATPPTNFERGVFDWTTTANTIFIGLQAGGTGNNGRTVKIQHGNGARLDVQNHNGFVSVSFDDSLSRNNFYYANPITFTNGDASSTAPFASFANIPATSVIRFGDGGANANGWLQWGGQARVSADFSVTSSVALVNVTGLSVNVAAGRTYQFEAELYVTDAAAGGVQAAIAGTATATAIQYVGFAIADNAIKAKTNATALATAVASTVTTETAGIIVRITGTITVNAAGTLTVQMAQNTSNATPTIAKRGSWFIVNDMP